MSRNLLLCLVMCLIVSSASHAQDRPKLGVTLSGGGARGLAHIGFVQAIEESGLEVDYITGTSMGSIIGAFWAAGYSGKQMEEILLNVEWENVFSSKAPLPRVRMLQKRDHNSFPLQLSSDSSGLVIPSGLVEAQEVWSILSYNLFHTYEVTDFNQLVIPFACVATDIETGDPVIIRSGNLVSAVRASMAIPSVFSAVEREGKVLVDGGVVDNFPVRLVQNMGADYVIGINVADTTKKLPDEKNFIEILYQLSTYKDAESFRKEKKAADIFIQADLEGFSTGSFTDAAAIVESSKQQAQLWLDRFKQVADSLGMAGSAQTLPESVHQLIRIDDISFVGIEEVSQKVFLKSVALAIGTVVSRDDMDEAIREAYATGLYKRVRHTLEPSGKGGAHLRFEVEEYPETQFRAGVHYNTFSDIALMAKADRRNALLENTHFQVKAAVSKNPRLYTNYDSKGGKNNRITLRLYGLHERMELPIFQNYLQTERYRSILSEIGVQYWWSPRESFAFGLGQAFSDQRFKPRIAPDVRFEANTHGLVSSMYLKWNSLDRNAFPTRGILTDITYRTYYNQHISATIFQYGQDGGILESFGAEIDPQEMFHTAWMRYESYFTKGRITQIIHLQAGQQFNTDAGIFNFFNVGGDIHFLNNQLTFTGLPENSVNATSIATMLMGLQVHLNRNFYLTGKWNAGWTDIYNQNTGDFRLYNRISGASLSLGHLSVLGPTTVAMFYNIEAKVFASYVNIGFAF